jgi:hypothetical protein
MNAFDSRWSIGKEGMIYRECGLVSGNEKMLVLEKIR